MKSLHDEIKGKKTTLWSSFYLFGILKIFRKMGLKSLGDFTIIIFIL